MIKGRTLAALAVSDMLRYYQIFLHIFLTLVTSGWQKSMESSGYGMVAQESRNDNQILLLHLDTY